MELIAGVDYNRNGGVPSLASHTVTGLVVHSNHLDSNPVQLRFGWQFLLLNEKPTSSS